MNPDAYDDSVRRKSALDNIFRSYEEVFREYLQCLPTSAERDCVLLEHEKEIERKENFDLQYTE